MGNWSSKSKRTSATSFSDKPATSHSATSFSDKPATSHSATSFSDKPATSHSATSFSNKPATSHSATSFSNKPANSHSATSFSNKPANSQPFYARTTSATAHVVAKSASQSIKYSTNNYITVKAQVIERQQKQLGDIYCPSKSLPSKFGLRVCPQYNSKEGCNATLCRRFHVCQYWVLKTCRRGNCEYDHSFTSAHNVNILFVVSRRKDLDINTISETLQNNHRQNRKPNGEYICVHNILKKCTRNPCSLVHNNKPYQWEVWDCSWIQFSYQQSGYLELLYSQPYEDTVELPLLPSNLSQIKGLKKLCSLLSKAQSWYVDLENMSLHSGNLCFYVQRLSTPSDITCDFNLATRWIWYWEDDDGSWKPYTDGVAKYFDIALSDQLERHMLSERKHIYQVKVGGHSYEINTHDKTQRNLETGKIRKVRRRPVCRMLEHVEHSFDRMFSSPPGNQKYMLLPVLPITSEFILIEKMMAESLFNICILSIHRIRNDYLWKTYQTKKSQLLTLYSKDDSMVNEQYLFHGTKHSIIDKICSDNLDWRLFGSNVGNVYGQGTYFSNKASLADNYSETNGLGQKTMFVVFVLVATMTVGNSRMEFPPENPKTGRCFDTTCNDQFNSTVFVKYNRDEHYPAYIVKYTHK